jgi:hypothetical protein
MPGLSVHSAYYSATIETLVETPNESILGELTARSVFAVEPPQRDAWLEELNVLKAAVSGLDGTVFLEFDVPRIGSRIDAVLISGPVVFVIEFKVGQATFNTADYNQAWDYALDLKNFHLASHRAPIVPILVATGAPDREPQLLPPADDRVYPPVTCSASMLREAIRRGLAATTGPDIDPIVWATSRYQPTPTIIEAAQALYAHHSVESIARHEADAQNLGITSRRIEEIVEAARSGGRKAIIFVTGVPGAGKTLVGLNLATKKRGDGQHAVFLSGNGPLVAVLREALARDEVARARLKRVTVRKGVAQQKVKAFIQNVHHFRDEGLNQPGPPVDRVVIFDEAQRAWDQPMLADFMRRKRKRPGFAQSEPEVLLEYLDRHSDWAAVVCLVGGGQEINRGEAGISAWLGAVSTRFANWSAHISPSLTDTEYAAGQALRKLGSSVQVKTDEALHLSVSMRSFRAENLSKFVKSVLDMERAAASGLLEAIGPRYPIVLTRDLEEARAWIRRHARGSERYGLVASSGAMRLKPHAVDVRIQVDPIHYFLNDRHDTRSSFYMEDAATEFQVQGLELDWIVVNWDADFRFTDSGWSCHSFVASRWHSMKKQERRSYLKNAYRVLLTRARQGMAIFVPPGNSADPTRSPAFYDATFEYLRSVGIPAIDSSSG